MTDKKQTESAAVEFDIKHRVTGAAVLLFIGALLIPWLLGPPSEASKRQDIAAEESTGSLTPASEIEKALLPDSSQTPVDLEETVYISKITPLDGGGVRQSNNESEDSNASEADSEQTSQKADKDSTVDSSASTNANVPDNKDAIAVDKQAAQQKKANAAAIAKKNAEAADKAEQRKREQALKAALDAESQTASIEVGWVVQVGLYLEAKGAESKMRELQKQGFTPGSTIVDTNRGPKTGTRVWLGPFEKRTAAEQENKKLRTQTGKDGFIRVYP